MERSGIRNFIPEKHVILGVQLTTIYTGARTLLFLTSIFAKKVKNRQNLKMQ